MNIKNKRRKNEVKQRRKNVFHAVVIKDGTVKHTSTWT